MRILYLTARYPFPLNNGGTIRQYNFIRQLATHHAITLLALSTSGFPADEGGLAALEPITDYVAGFKIGAARASPLARTARRLHWRLGNAATDEAIGRLSAEAADLHAKLPFDAVFVSGLVTLEALRALPGLPTIVDLCDAVSTYMRSEASLKPPGRLPLYLLDYARVRRAERRACSVGTRVLFAAARDCATLMGSRNLGRAVIVPTGVDTGQWTRHSSRLGRQTVVFTGALDYPPNGDAALHLLRSIMPLVWEAEPESRLLLVGKNPTAALIDAGRSPRVTITGEVPDLRQYMEEGAVFAAPVRFGAGIQTKLLEAMALELPVVASPLAAGGLRGEDGQEPPLIVAATAELFATRIVEHLRAAEQGAAPLREAREFVVRNFEWSRVGARLERAVLDAASEGASPPRQVG